jgi:hypothetical protein
MSQALGHIDGLNHYSEWLGTAAFAIAQPTDRSFVHCVGQELVAAEASQRNDPSRRDMLNSTL